MEQITGLKTSDYYFDLPQELIAQDPLEDRTSSRLLVMDKNTGKTEHRVFSDIREYLRPGDTLVLNNTKVIPARLLGTKEDTGANVEILLLKRISADRWETLVRPGKKLKPGARITFGDGSLKAVILDILDEGNRLVEFEYEGIFEVIEALYPLCYLSVTSNGLPLEDDGVWQKLQKYRPDKIHVTIHQPDNEKDAQTPRLSLSMSASEHSGL